MSAITECHKRIDYSKVTGDRIPPFVFELNLKDSNLYPEEGEKQRFCYNDRNRLHSCHCNSLCQPRK